MVGQFSGVQNSVRVPYRRFTWLKKSTAVAKGSSRDNQRNAAKNEIFLLTQLCHAFGSVII